MRRTRLVLSLVLPLAASILAVAPARAATPVRYVALGDSYSSGVGTDNTSGSCAQSPQAYPALYAAAAKVASFTFAACSGATTADVRNTQIASLSTATNLVSITIGGNDVGFTGVLETCILHSTSDCVTAVNNAETYARNTLPGLLDQTYALIRSHAPAAKVVVLTYPVFYDLNASPCYGLSGTDHAKIDEGIGVLDSVVQSAVGRAKFTFADDRSGFNGHQICDGGSKWLHSLNYSDIDESYHPTTDGHAGALEPAFVKAVS